MKIDLTNLVTNITNSIIINEKVNISDEILKTSSIKRLDNVFFEGRITKDYDMNLELSGVISGIMILSDDITLEDTEYKFKVDILENIEETFEIVRNNIDILDFLWQTILVEVPLKVRNPKNENIKLEGNGWRLITEDELNNRKYNPFSELSKLLDKEGSE